MKLSLYSSIGWRHPLGLGHVVSLARATGYDLVSIRGRSTDTRAPDLQQVQAVGYDMLSAYASDPEGVAALKAMMEERGVGVYCLSTYATFIDPDPSVRQDSVQRIRRAVEFAPSLGAPIVRSIGHVVNDAPYDRQEIASWFDDGIRQLMGDLKRHDVRVQIENCERAYPETAAEVNQILAAHDGGRVVAAFDPVNSVFSGLDPVTEFEALRTMPDAIHVKDVAKGPGGFQWVPVGTGVVDWGRIIRTARERGFDGVFVCEYVNPHKLSDFHGWERLMTPEEWARDTASFLKDTWSGQRAS